MVSAWAYGTLFRTCELLQATFGAETCRVEPSIAQTKFGPRELIFEPPSSSGDDDAKCPCDTVDRVQIHYTQAGKHSFPIHRSCPWWHTPGLAAVGDGCNTVHGRPVEEYADIWSCMQESSCQITDERVQFVAMRDPRAVAVSTYFWVPKHLRRDLVRDHHPALNHTLDEAVLEILEDVSRWTSVRDILFNGVMSDRSTIFWYEDAKSNPLEWHSRWAHMAGLHLPAAWVEDIAGLASNDIWAWLTMPMNQHPGGNPASANRTWRDEVSPEILDDIDDVLRRWLPPLLQARFGVLTP
ncbi:unnamed protein product [Pylaiella littoralis]